MNNLDELINHLNINGYGIERIEADYSFLVRFIADENRKIVPFNAMLSTTIHKVNSELYDARFWYSNKENAIVVMIKNNNITTMTISNRNMFKLALDDKVPYRPN